GQARGLPLLAQDLRNGHLVLRSAMTPPVWRGSALVSLSWRARGAMDNQGEHPPQAGQHQRLQQEESWGFDRRVIDYIHHAAATGLYEIRGLGAKRQVPHFDDLVFLAGSA